MMKASCLWAVPLLWLQLCLLILFVQATSPSSSPSVLVPSAGRRVAAAGPTASPQKIDGNSGVGPSIAMYEISTRPWLYILSQKYETNITMLSQIPDQEFLDLKQSGIDIVWMMGVWQLGQYGLNIDRTNPGLLYEYSQVLPGYMYADIIGSPYAVVNYTTNSQLGSDADLKALRAKLNSMGLLLMLDFVPNHTAVDCPWTSSDPDYYVRAPQNDRPPYDPNMYLPNGIAYGSAGGDSGWIDTAQLNYWNDDARAARLKELMYVASLSDAVRCDMAYLLLNDLIEENWGYQLSSWGYQRPSSEWWTEAIQTVKATYPSFIFLAEVYSPYQPDLQALGFDYTYDKQLLDRLGGGSVGSIQNWLTSNTPSFISHSAHFLSNHDQIRAIPYFGSWWRSDAAALLAYTLPGMRFYWMGQWQGYTAKLDIHLRRETSEPVDQDVQEFYGTLTGILSDPVFKFGQWTYLNVFGASTAWQLIAYRWSYGNENRLCIINFSGNQGQGRVLVSNAAARNGNDTIPITDLLSGTTYYRSANAMRTQGLYVIVNPWWAQIFTY